MIAVPVASVLEGTATALGVRHGVTIGLAEIVGDGRTAERAAGRAAARTAFDRAGAPGLGVLGNAPDGRPRWPRGWAGSISHGAGVAVAAVGRRDRAVGIDVERSGALPVEDAEAVLAPTEMELATRAAEPAFVTTVIWSAKETAFKAWSGACGGLTGVNPVDILIDVDFRAGSVRARPGRGLIGHPASLGLLKGGFAMVDEVLLTVMTGRTRAREKS
jgi:4'-phosphopantetheinyl transferase EntD